MTPSRKSSNPAEPAPEKPDETYPRRKRCDNCPQFLVIASKRAKHKRFCSAKCRREWFRFGSAYGPLKEQLEKLIEAKTKEATKAETENQKFIERLRVAGFLHRGQLKKIKPEHTRRGMQSQIDTLSRLVGELIEDVRYIRDMNPELSRPAYRLPAP
jgi:hypothetical protein